MYSYAVLDENSICKSVVNVYSKMNYDNYIEITNYSDEYLNMKYENGIWTGNEFVEISENEILNSKLDYLTMLIE